MYAPYAPYPSSQYPIPWGNVPPMSQNWQSLVPMNGQDIQGVRFVNGIEEAKNCTIPFGTKVLLMDKNVDRFYIKETDSTGVSTVSEYEFKKVEAVAPQEYVTKQEFDQLSFQLKEQYESTIQRIEQLNQSTPVAPRVDPANIPTVANVPLTGVHQNDYTGTSQAAGGAAYQGTRNYPARI